MILVPTGNLLEQYGDLIQNQRVYDLTLNYTAAPEGEVKLVIKKSKSFTSIRKIYFTGKAHLPKCQCK